MAFNYLRARGNSIEGGHERNPTKHRRPAVLGLPRAIDTMNFELPSRSNCCGETTRASLTKACPKNRVRELMLTDTAFDPPYGKP